MSFHVEEVLNRIQRNISLSGTLITQADYATAKSLLNQSASNLNRIEPVISNNRFHTISDTIQALCGICDQNVYEENSIETDCSYSTERRVLGRGRPTVIINENQLRFFLAEGYTASKIGKLLKCCKSVVYNRMAELNLSFRQKYTYITDEDLQQIISDIKSNFPNSGSKMMSGYLRSRGLFIQRSRVRNILRTIDPVGTACRWSRTTKRRVYNVPAPNSLWHMDAHLKLVRWGFVTHGCIDGYSRLIIYLKCEISISAKTVIQIFMPGVIKYGLPSRVRSDHGYENFFVAVLMNLLRGVNRGSHITGKSVHNQRIERLWRDVFEQVIERFYTEFYSLEEENRLDPNNDTHKFVLQFVYLKEINECLNMFVTAWNNHKIRTEGRTPREMWLQGILTNANSNYTSVQEVLNEDSNLIRRVERSFENVGVNINEEVINTSEEHSETYSIPLNDDQHRALQSVIDNCNSSTREKYLAGLRFFEQLNLQGD